MKLPVSWLNKYLSVSWTPERLAEALTLSGTKVEHIDKKSGDAILEIEITTNRPDCLSILGLAQEVAVLSGKKIKFPKIPSDKKSSEKASFEILVEDKNGCPKYTARLIKNVVIKPAPSDVQKCLESMGSRPINNAVDATNFVLFEMGQPLHAFDYDKLIGGKIIVRRAKKGEKFLGIDGVEYTLDEKVLVIADAERAVAIAGVMGGKLTEVTDSTKNILLESAYFDPGLVRQASRRYKLSTESSYRFERGVNFENVSLASARTADLIKEWSGGSQSGPFVEKSAFKEKKPASVLVSFDLIDKLIGLKISPSKILSILKTLGFQVKPKGKTGIFVTPPSSRADICLEADIVEEILRVEGFDKVPSALPITRHSDTAIRDPKASGVLELKKYLSNIGFSEIITYSLLPERLLLNASFTELGRAQKIANALSAEQEYLRPLLLPGMLQSILYNVHRKAASLKLFEIGNRYVDGREETVLAISLYGNSEENWLRKNPASFYELKGITENILNFLHVKEYAWKENEPCPKYENSSTLNLNEKKIGTLGLINQNILKNWDIPHAMIYAEYVLENLFKNSSARESIRVRSLPKFPLVRRDIAFVIDEKVSVQSIQKVMKDAALPYLSDIQLFDQYTGKNIASGKRSLAFSLAYQKETSTFTDEEINALQSKVSDALKSAYHVELR